MKSLLLLFIIVILVVEKKRTMPKQQSNLDSFLGITQGKAKKQKTLTSYFGKGKENKKKKEEDADEEQDDVVAKQENNAAVAAKKKNNRRRPVIDDDDSDVDDDDGVNNEKPMKMEVDEEVGDSKPPSVKNEKEGEEEEESKPSKTKKNDESEEKKKSSATADFFKAKKSSDKKDIKTKDKEEEKKKPAESASASATTTEVKEEPMKEEDEKTRNGDNSKQRKVLISRAKRMAKAAKVEWEVDTITSPVAYKDLVKSLEKIEAITGRLEIQSILTKFLRQVLISSPKDLHQILYLASCSVAPAYECVELGIGDSILMKAIAEAYGTNDKSVKGKYANEGDLGKVAMSCKSKQRTLSFGIKPKPLMASDVLQSFREIAGIAGSKSQKLKVDKIKKLLVRVQDPAETKYIIRGLQGKLRIGLAESTVLISLAHAVTFTIPESVDCSVVTEDNGEDDDDENMGNNEKLFLDETSPIDKRLEAAAHIVKQAYNEVPSYDALLDGALKVPISHLKQACSFKAGIPVCPMLAKPTKSIQEVLKRLNGTDFTCEFKYDGERVQVHKTTDGQFKAFSRNLLETTSKFPEVLEYVQEASTDDVSSFVVDAEVVAFNRETGNLAPFQLLSTRKKTETSGETAKVQVIVQAFDLMYLNGESLLNKKLSERRELLLKHFQPVDQRFQFAKSRDFVEDGDTTALEQFLDLSVKGKCEGLMVKTMDDVYEPSRRSLNWLKLKKDYLDGLGDSFDLVPLGAYFGKGKRTGVYGAYLLACYDEDSEEFQSVCKIGTGFSDEDLQTLSKALNEHKLDGKSSQYNVADGLECDVWFDTVQVWEVKAADLSLSPAHRGAIGKTGDGRGIGLRFPRFERIRDDKKPDMATTSDQVLDCYYNQDSVKGQDAEDDGDDGI